MRAGESGRAFVVVADEVRTLSLRVTGSSCHIFSIIDAPSRLVGDASGAVDGIPDRLHRIGENATEISDVVAEVAERRLRDARRTDQLNATMGDMRNGAGRTADLSGDAHETADMPGRSSSELAELVGRFQTKAQRASRAA